MHNVIVLGVPRSGTSLTASLFRDAGFFTGDHPLTPSESNPKGYYEDREINSLNNRLIRDLGITPKHVPLRTTARLLRFFGISAPSLDVRAWAHLIPRYPTRHRPHAKLVHQMRDVASRRPFCYKDPRFTYTLGAWESVLPEDTRFIVVFRSPQSTIYSMLKNAKTVYTPHLPLTHRYCDRVYYHNYGHLLDTYSDDRRFCFVSYDKVLSGEALGFLERFTGANLDKNLADESLSRSKAAAIDLPVSARCEDMFARLSSASLIWSEQ